MCETNVKKTKGRPSKHARRVMEAYERGRAAGLSRAEAAERVIRRLPCVRAVKSERR